MTDRDQIIYVTSFGSRNSDQGSNFDIKIVEEKNEVKAVLNSGGQYCALSMRNVAVLSTAYPNTSLPDALRAVFYAGLNAQLGERRSIDILCGLKDFTLICSNSNGFDLFHQNQDPIIARTNVFVHRITPSSTTKHTSFSDEGHNIVITDGDIENQTAFSDPSLIEFVNALGLQQGYLALRRTNQEIQKISQIATPAKLPRQSVIQRTKNRSSIRQWFASRAWAFGLGAFIGLGAGGYLNYGNFRSGFMHTISRFQQIPIAQSLNSQVDMDWSTCIIGESGAFLRREDGKELPGQFVYRDWQLTARRIGTYTRNNGSLGTLMEVRPEDLSKDNGSDPELVKKMVDSQQVISIDASACGIIK